jgi:transposase InsO family protein
MVRSGKIPTKEFIKKYYSKLSNDASFTSPEKLRSALEKNLGVKLQRQKILDAISELRSYSLHKQNVTNFEKNPTVVREPDFQWQMDITFFPDLAEKDNALLVAIDVVSKRIDAIPLANKKATTVSEATEKMLKKVEPNIPRKIQTDHGKEFENRHFRMLMKKYNIKHFMTRTNSLQKAAVVERVNRTIKEKLYRVLDANPHLENKWHTLIQPLVKSYNNTYHSAIKMTPNEVNDSNAGSVLTNLYGKYWLKDRKWKSPKFKVGDYVRISSERHPFTKAYRGKWKEELFQIEKIKYALPNNMYLLKDWHGELVAGSFYPAELQKIPFESRDKHEFQIEKIIQERVRNGQKEVLVRWAGYSSKDDTWEPKQNIIKLTSTLK